MVYTVYQKVVRMNYSKEVTKSHPLSIRYSQQAIISLNVLLKKEGARKCPFTQEEVLDLDKIEVILKSKCSSRCETMDFCIGLVTRQMLLVEAKLRVVEPRNLKKGALEDKIRYSKALLGQEIPITREKVFLFTDKTVDIAKRHLARLFNNNPNLIVCTIDEFKSLVVEQ